LKKCGNGMIIQREKVLQVFNPIRIGFYFINN
jgi:hypothetical protein